MSEPSPGSATGTTAAHVGRAFLYAAIVTAAAALPLVLWPFDSALIGDTYGRAYRPFELLGLTGSVAILLIAGLELRRRRRRTLADVLPVVVPVLVALTPPREGGRAAPGVA